VRRSLNLRIEPTLRQTEEIIARIEHEMAQRGAAVERVGFGGLRFRVPPPWRARRLGVLLAITAGRVMVSAGAGGPWRVRYELSFVALRTGTLLLSLGIAILRFGGNRLALLAWIAVLWLLLYTVPYLAATRLFHRLVMRSAREVVERRRAPRVAAPDEVGPTRTPPAPPTPS
jgi:hypothetical protein